MVAHRSSCTLLVVLVGMFLGTKRCIILVHGSAFKETSLATPNAAHSYAHHRFGLLDASGHGRAMAVELPNNDDDKADHSSVLSNENRGNGRRRRLGPLNHVKASLLTAGLVFLLLRNLLWTTEPFPWPTFLLLGVLYLLEALQCSTRRYLSNMLTPSEVQNYMARLQKEMPRVKFHVECYHYASDHHYHYGHYGHLSSLSRRRQSSSTRRVTYRASDVFLFQQWKDATNKSKLLETLMHGDTHKAPYLKISIAKLITFADLASYHGYQMQQDRFLLREGNRDFYRDSWTTIQVDGFLPKVLAVRTGLGSKAHVRRSVFWLCTLLLLTVPYRIWFSRNCEEADLVLVKEVS